MSEPSDGSNDLVPADELTAIQDEADLVLARTILAGLRTLAARRHPGDRAGQRRFIARYWRAWARAPGTEDDHDAERVLQLTFEERCRVDTAMGFAFLRGTAGHWRSATWPETPEILGLISQGEQAAHAGDWRAAYLAWREADAVFAIAAQERLEAGRRADERLIDEALALRDARGRGMRQRAEDAAARRDKWLPEIHAARVRLLANRPPSRPWSWRQQAEDVHEALTKTELAKTGLEVPSREFLRKQLRQTCSKRVR